MIVVVAKRVNRIVTVVNVVVGRGDVVAAVEVIKITAVVYCSDNG